MVRDSFELSSPTAGWPDNEDDENDPVEIFPKFCEIIECNKISWTKVKISRQSTYLVPSVLLHQPSYDWIKNRFNGSVSPSVDHLRFKTRLDGSTFLRIKQSTASSSSTSSSSSSSSRVQTAYRPLTNDEVRQINVLRSHFSDDNTLNLKPKEISANPVAISPAVVRKSRMITKKGREEGRESSIGKREEGGEGVCGGEEEEDEQVKQGEEERAVGEGEVGREEEEEEEGKERVEE